MLAVFDQELAAVAPRFAATADLRRLVGEECANRVLDLVEAIDDRPAVLDQAPSLAHQDVAFAETTVRAVVDQAADKESEMIS